MINKFLYDKAQFIKIYNYNIYYICMYINTESIIQYFFIIIIVEKVGMSMEYLLKIL